MSSHGQAVSNRLLTNRRRHITQLYSHGRLLVTEEVFEELLARFGVFPRLKDILLYQGRRSLEVEVGPPRLQGNLSPQAVVGRTGTGLGVFDTEYISLSPTLHSVPVSG